MKIRDYFETATGTGVLATADAEGKVDAAIYARPHMLEDGTLAFVMLDRLTHKNLQSNPYATFLFMEKGEDYKGVRLFLKKLREDNDPELIESLSRRCLSPDQIQGPKFLVIFRLEKFLNLLGAGTPELDM